MTDEIEQARRENWTWLHLFLSRAVRDNAALRERCAVQQRIIDQLREELDQQRDLIKRAKTFFEQG